MSVSNKKINLNGMYRTIKKPYGRWVDTKRVLSTHIPQYKITAHERISSKLNKENKLIPQTLFANVLQPLYRITEYKDEKGRTHVFAKFAKYVPVEEWEKYPYYGQHIINEIC